MSTADIALIVIGAVAIVAIVCFWHLLKIGGGLQVRTPPVPTEKQVEKAIAARQESGQAAPVEEIAAKREAA